MSENIQAISDADFETEVIQSDTPVLLDFWAEWCAPCKALAPVLNEVFGSYQGKVKFMKMNVDENPETPAKFGVRGIPTLILFKGGDKVATKIGALAKSQLTAFLDSNL